MTAVNIAPHVEAAKRLLRELEQHADAAVDVLNRGGGVEFLAVVKERETLLAQLGQVVDVLAHERAQSGRWTADQHREADTMIGELARAANGVHASHERLVSQVTVERDRLAAAVRRSEQPDSIASHYAAMSHAPRLGTLSVTG